MVKLSSGIFPGNLVGDYLLNFSDKIIKPIINEEGITTYYLISDDLTLVTKKETVGILYKCEGKKACIIESSEGIYPNEDVNTINKFQNAVYNKNYKNNLICISSIIIIING